MDFKDFDKDFKNAAEQVQHFLQTDGPRVVGSIALEFIQDNFQLQGFQSSSGLQKWQERKVTDSNGNDKRYYKRGKRAGRLTRFGEKEKDRNILVGHDSGDKLNGSFHAETAPGTVDITNDKEYAEFHNEGSDNLPERAMIQPSNVMDEEAERQFSKRINKLLP